MILALLVLALFVGFFFGSQYMKSMKYDDAINSTGGREMRIFSHTAPAEMSFESFQLEYPSNMTSFVSNNQITNQNHLDKSENLFFRLEKGSSSMEIVSAAMGGGGCLYPGDPDQEGPYGRYGEYKTLRTDVGYWRRSLSLSQSTPDEKRTKYTICSNIDESGLFSTTTLVGGIVYKISPGEEDYISDFDEVVKSIKIIEK